MSQIYDKRGVPILPGDLLRSQHFRGRRRKMYYLYHVAAMLEGRLWAIPTAELEPTKVGLGGRVLISSPSKSFEVIDGYGKGVEDFWDDRKRVTA